MAVSGRLEWVSFPAPSCRSADSAPWPLKGWGPCCARSAASRRPSRSRLRGANPRYSRRGLLQSLRGRAYCCFARPAPRIVDFRFSRDCYASCMAWVVTAAGTLKGTRPQPKLATHCTKPIHEAVGNGFPKGAPRIRLRRYSSCSHENLFLGEKIRKSSRRRNAQRYTPPAAAGGLWRPLRRRGGPWRGV